MTLLIAHRGLINGPDTSIENSPTTFLSSRKLGYDVEIDLWYQNNNWYLGHDAPTYMIDFDFIKEIDYDYDNKHHSWIHAKNIEALYKLVSDNWQGHMFYHQQDDVVLTNTGYLWTFPGKTLTNRSVCVMPEWIDAIKIAKTLDVYAFCSDYINEIKNTIE